MNQLMVNDFVITSNSLLINDEIVKRAAMPAREESTSPTKGACATRNNQVWNEELVLTNIMRNNHRLSCESIHPGESGSLLSSGLFENKSLLRKAKSDVSKNKIVKQKLMNNCK